MVGSNSAIDEFCLSMYRFVFGAFFKKNNYSITIGNSRQQVDARNLNAFRLTKTFLKN